MSQIRGAVLWLSIGALFGAGLYSFSQHIARTYALALLVVAAIPGLVTWTLDSYKKVLEIRKLHQEIATLTREANQDRQGSNLVQRVSAELPKGFTPPYGTRDVLISKIEGREYIKPHFQIEE